MARADKLELLVDDKLKCAFHHTKVRRAQTAIQCEKALVLDDFGDTMEAVAVPPLRTRDLALQLHARLHKPQGAGDRSHRHACRYGRQHVYQWVLLSTAPVRQDFFS